MPEEANNTQTTQETAENDTNTADTAAAATTTAEAAEKPAEAAKEAEAPAEEKYTLDSYKDLIDEETAQGFEINEENLKAFKELGVANNIAPATLKAFAKWSFDNLKAQQQEEARIKAEWQKHNQEKYGENLKNVKTNVGRVLADMDKTGQFANLLKTVGAEEHPATLEFLSAIGDVILEKGSVNPNASVQGKDLSLEYMYRNNK